MIIDFLVIIVIKAHSMANSNTFTAAAKKDPKFCPCGLPCLSTIFVPSLSFATLTGGGSSSANETLILSKKLADAREKGA